VNLFIEPLVLFLVLFFPGFFQSIASLSVAGVQVFSFNENQEIFRIITYNIPALCLLWYFLLKEPIRSLLGTLKPEKKDFFEVIKVLAGLLIIGFAVSASINLVSQNDTMEIHVPNVISWLIVAISCISTGYVEESYFRVYLLNRLALSGISQKTAILAASVLFAICHIYQGPLGFVSSLLAGLFLSFMYVKKRSVHGIAAGHGLYNIVSYVLVHFAYIN
jgi:membrane protease YdiL (CAAX protease family)